SVNVTDITVLMKHLIGASSIKSENIKNADLNGDGKISIIDLIKLKNKLS
ncbi:MAG: dockerin type I repeat-containing protein, partial [Oscillospiraceae bacterium]|nr:dockerin type I repeat-containing protein [Oscillospiraceae bacterium]